MGGRVVGWEESCGWMDGLTAGTGTRTRVYREGGGVERCINELRWTTAVVPRSPLAPPSSSSR